jgi:hypothetical protein
MDMMEQDDRNIDGTEESQFDDRNDDCDTTNQDMVELQNVYSMEDNEVIIDNEKFENEDVELISGNIENNVNNFTKEPNQEEIYSQLRNIEAQEVIDISDQDNEMVTKKIEPDTEAVSEDELPTEATAKVFNIKFINNNFFYSKIPISILLPNPDIYSRIIL